MVSAGLRGFGWFHVFSVVSDGAVVSVVSSGFSRFQLVSCGFSWLQVVSAGVSFRWFRGFQVVSVVSSGFSCFSWFHLVHRGNTPNPAKERT